MLSEELPEEPESDPGPVDLIQAVGGGKARYWLMHTTTGTAKTFYEFDKLKIPFFHCFSIKSLMYFHVLLEETVMALELHKSFSYYTFMATCSLTFHTR